MKKMIMFAAALLLTAVAWAQQPIDTDFTQIRHLKMSGKTTDKAGHITFDGKDQLSMIYTEPEGEFFIVEGDRVKMNLNGKKAELDASKVKLVKLQRATLLNCLAGHWEQAAVDNNADTTVDEADGFRHVFIKAKGKVPRGGYNSVDLIYRLSDGALVKMVLEEAVGVINTYEIK